MLHKTIRVNSNLFKQAEEEESTDLVRSDNSVKFINYNVFSLKEMPKIVDLNPNLTNLEFYNIKNIEVRFPELIIGLKYSTITKLSINECGFFSQDLLFNFVGQLKDTNITYLDISKNGLGYNKLPKIVSLVEDSNIKILDMSSNELMSITSWSDYERIEHQNLDNILSLLANNIKYSQLEEIYMRNMLHGDKEFLFVSQLIRNITVDNDDVLGMISKSLRYLDLSCDDDSNAILHSMVHNDMSDINIDEIYRLLNNYNENNPKFSIDELTSIMDEYIEMPEEILGLIYDLSANALEIDI